MESWEMKILRDLKGENRSPMRQVIDYQMAMHEIELQKDILRNNDRLQALIYGAFNIPKELIGKAGAIPIPAGIYPKGMYLTNGGGKMEYNFNEVIGMIEEGEVYQSLDWRIKKFNENLIIEPLNRNNINQVVIYKNARFTKQRKEVAFKELMDNNKYCTVEHNYLRRKYSVCMQIESGSGYIDNAYKKMRDGEVVALDGVMGVLAHCCTPDILRAIIKNGNWYIE